MSLERAVRALLHKHASSVIPERLIPAIAGFVTGLPIGLFSQETRKIVVIYVVTRVVYLVFLTYRSKGCIKQELKHFNVLSMGLYWAVVLYAFCYEQEIVAESVITTARSLHVSHKGDQQLFEILRQMRK